MQSQTLDRPAAPGNAPKVARPEAECNPPPEGRAQDDEPDAREILEGWVVQIPSRLVNVDLGAVIVWAVSTAWRYRGIPGPPGVGWAKLAGVPPRTWQRWRTLAIGLGLIEMRGARIAPLARLEPGEQFARVPLAILIDKQLSRTARRGYIALALFRTGLGYSRASVRTLSRASGLNRGNVQKGLRELENRFHITACGATGRGVQRYFLGGQTTPAAPDSGTKNTPKSTESYPPYPQNGQKRCPSQGSKSAKNDAPQGSKSAKNDAPNRPKTMPLLQENKNLSLQKGRAPPAPPDSQAPRGPTKAEARCTLNRFGMRGAGVDFGKPAKSGPQGKAKPVEEPPSKPKWRPLRHGQALEKNWTAETERLGGAGLFQTVKNAVPQLPRRKEVAK